MREHKYKAWYKPFESDKYVMSQPFSIWDIDWECDQLGETGIYGVDSEDITFLEYTGLKDKNGIEIYEHSILRDERGVEYEVQDLDFYIESGNNLGIFVRDGFLVVGNKYENEGK